MNPWLWLLWALAALVLLFIGSAAVAGVVESVRRKTPTTNETPAAAAKADLSPAERDVLDTALAWHRAIGHGEPALNAAWSAHVAAVHQYGAETELQEIVQKGQDR
jgi:uncharacterized membrane protein